MISQEKGYNLFDGLTDLRKVKAQGDNGPIWALLALNSNPAYTIPQDSSAKVQTTEEGLIEAILDAQKSDGGWNLSGSKADSDLTGMALYALAPYYNSDATVKAAIDKALETLSGMQNDNGTFGTGGKETCESTVQVIVALCSLDIDPATDARFVKSGGSAIDGLKSYYKEENGKCGFMHLKAGGSASSGEGAAGVIDSMATEQAVYALNSYQRFLKGENSFFDMSDVQIGDVTLGDVNGDGKISVSDITAIQLYLANKRSFSDRELTAADVTKDGKVSVSDITKIQLKLANKISEF